MSTKILFHSFDGDMHCNDGYGAAYAAWLKYRDKAVYVPCAYGQEPPEIEAGDEVFLLDFSYPKDVLEAWQKIADVKVLDHHSTARQNLEGLPFATFDMQRSGAQMAWDFFWGGEEGVKRPALVDYIGDRDLWKKELIGTEEVHRALSVFPQDFEVWDTLAKIPNYIDFMFRIGKPLYKKYLVEVEELVHTARHTTFDGMKVMCIRSDRSDLVSEALNQICKRNPEIPFAYNVHSIDTDQIKYELRSVGEFHVGNLALSKGGGGHHNAAGFIQVMP